MILLALTLVLEMFWILNVTFVTTGTVCVQTLANLGSGDKCDAVAAGQGRQIRQCRPRNLFEKNTI
jgi:hypothetical protein